MVRPLDITEFLAHGTPTIDVRSPAEHAYGHVPGARSLPLFTNEERAVVGTLYKQRGRDAAVLEGLRIVGPKLAGIVEEALSIAPDGHVRVHCWRGGERSASVAWLLDKAGFTEVATLKGGYKAFRNQVLASFHASLPLIILGGYTGSGKTEILHALREHGEQVVDMEGLANHRGSSFGALGLPPQPSTEHFENLLWHELRKLDPTRPIWLEDESMLIGRVKIPDALFAQLRAANMFFIDMPQEVRAQRLVADYGKADPKDLREAILRIQKRMGPQHCKAALQALDAGDLFAVAKAALTYYDKAYLFGLEKRDPLCVRRVPAPVNDLRDLALRTLENAHARTN